MGKDQAPRKRGHSGGDAGHSASRNRLKLNAPRGGSRQSGEEAGGGGPRGPRGEGRKRPSPPRTVSRGPSPPDPASPARPGRSPTAPSASPAPGSRARPFERGAVLGGGGLSAHLLPPAAASSRNCSHLLPSLPHATPTRPPPPHPSRRWRHTRRPRRPPRPPAGHASPGFSPLVIPAHYFVALSTIRHDCTECSNISPPSGM